MECRRPDSRVREFIDAEAEVSADLRRRRDEWQRADNVTLRSNDFPAANALSATGQTSIVVTTFAPAGNDLYEVHWKVQINPIVPNQDTLLHWVELVIESNADLAGWVQRALFRYEVARKAGQPSAPVKWDHESELCRIPGLDPDDQIRIRVRASGTNGGNTGWSFSVHGFNATTDLDSSGGLTYHTGLAVDFHPTGGVCLADLSETLLESATQDGYMTDLNGAPGAAASPFFVAGFIWGTADHRDIPIDRVVAMLNPRVDPAQPRNVKAWVCQLLAMKNYAQVGASASMDAELVPLATAVTVPAQDGDTPEEITFNWGSLPEEQKPHPKRVTPSNRSGAGVPTNVDGPLTLMFVWALQADGSPATNAGWAQDSATAQVQSGTKKLRTIFAQRLLSRGIYWLFNLIDANPLLRCRFETGNYPVSEVVAFNTATPENRLALVTTPTKTVQFVCRADVPLGATAVFEVRNDADAAWVGVTDGQTTDDIGVARNRVRGARVTLTSTPARDATPIVAEFGMRELDIIPLHYVAKLEQARWAVDPLLLTSETTNARIVAYRDDSQDFQQEFADRVTRILTEYFIGQITLRVWVGTPERPRWLHIDDFLIDDEEFHGPEAGIPCLGMTTLERGTLPPYDSATQTVLPITYANKSLKFAYDDIMAKIGLSGRQLGPGIGDNNTLVSKVLTESDAKRELDALNYLDGSARISSQGRIKTVRIFGNLAPVRIFSREAIKWASLTPGFRSRQPELRIPWNWSDDEDRYRDEHKAVHGPALLRLGRARIDPPQLLDDVITKWIAAQSLAERIGKRHVGAVGAGLMLWYFGTEYAEPHIEPGDCCVLPTNVFAGRDPVADRPLRGALAAIGVIVATSEDFKTFAMFVRSYADLQSSSEVGTRLDNPAIISATLNWVGDSLVAAWVGNSALRSIKAACDDVGQPAPGTGNIFNQNTGEATVLRVPSILPPGIFGGVTFSRPRPQEFVTLTPYSGLDASGVQGPALMIRTKEWKPRLLDVDTVQLEGQNRTISQIVTHLVPNGDFDIWKTKF